MTKEEDFKQRFIAVLKDLQANGTRDGQAMWLIGSLAAGLADDLKAVNWSSAKRGMDPETYDALLREFETQGNEHHRASRGRQAYAIQTLAVSLIAGTQTADPQMASGEILLDEIIDHAVAAFRLEAKAR